MYVRLQANIIIDVYAAHYPLLLLQTKNALAFRQER